MAGIYVHIPFCKSMCAYCDFYSVSDTGNAKELIDAVCKEIEQKKNYLNSELIETIYVGGGTPSFIDEKLLYRIIKTIYELYNVSENAEITIEINPDDITKEKAKKIKDIGFNRISVGVQSFNDNYLTFLKRRHNVNQAMKAIQTLMQEGFTNLSIDLIYGIPDMTLKDWVKDLNTAVSSEVAHISAYHLTIEKGTELFSLLKNGKLEIVKDEISYRMYELLCEILNQHNFIHYEISNFSKPEMFSKHNKSYWEGNKYLGTGPSAHSFNGVSRQWNVSDNKKYIYGILNNESYFTTEKLTKKNRYNEYVLTRLRTDSGVSLSDLMEYFGTGFLEYFLKQAEKHFKEGNMFQSANGFITIPEKKWFVSDNIISDVCKI